MGPLGILVMIPWVELFAVFVVSHLVGDFLLQTDWQARHKPGGLGPEPTSRRALLSHILTYAAAFVPALVWVSVELGPPTAVGTAALVLAPHLLQDDGRLLAAYARTVKGPETPASILVAVDQCFHLVALFLVALLVGS